MHRRLFLDHTLKGATAALLLPLLSASEKLPAMGFISGILSNNITDDNWKETLKATVTMGYSQYEGRGMGSSVKEFSAFLTDIGLSHVAGGIKMTGESDQAQRELDNLTDLGVRYAVIYWPWFVSAPFSLSDCQRSVPVLNKLGEYAAQRGLMLCWHNHDMEFQPMENGIRPFDYLMQHTDKNLVSLELDIYWATKGGADPSELMRTYPGRTKLMHVKDMTADGSITCPGSGTIDFPAIFQEALRQDVNHFIVERDKAEDGLACLRTSSNYLKNLSF